MAEFYHIIKQVFLAGIGAAALGFEKTEALAGILVRRGEKTVKQGRVLNEELKHTMKGKTAPKKDPAPDVENMTAAERKELMRRLRAMEERDR